MCIRDRPYWASSLVKAATIGNHIFYRWRGGWGRPPAFLNRYAGVEPAIAWRGGFGQPSMAERLAAGDRDAAAAAAAEGAMAIGSVDSFNRAVLRRYEPLRRDTANEMISERARADTSLSNSQRWALTGRDDRAETPQQRPLGRWGTHPAETPPAPPPARPQASGNNANSTGTDASAAGSDATAAGADSGMISGQ